jgi:transketolase
MGLSKALGFALGQDRTVYVLLGDGEMMEGQNWEAALAISKSGVKNIVALVDCNRFSQDGEASLEPIDIQFMFIAAGWRTSSVVDGNNLEFVGNALKDACGLGKPWAIILNTIKGNGIEFADKWNSHFGPPGAVYPVHPLYKAFGEAVDAEMDQDEKVILVGADTLRDLQCYDLRNKYPGRVFDFGIAEQNAVSFASARALMGQKPIVATYACFLRRAFEQIYNQTTEGTQVVYVGSMAGRLDPSGPGISHQSLDDAEYMGGIMGYVWRLDRAVHAARLLHYALDFGQSSYLRLEHMTND